MENDELNWLQNTGLNRTRRLVCLDQCAKTVAYQLSPLNLLWLDSCA